MPDDAVDHRVIHEPGPHVPLLQHADLREPPVVLVGFAREPERAPDDRELAVDLCR